MPQISPSVKEFLSSELNSGVEDSLSLLAMVKQNPDSLDVSDYSFVVFPMAKAYEGFLKLYFKKRGMLNEKHFRSRHFRIGRSFNPDLPTKYKDEVWLYDDVSRLCGESIARQMWEIWIDGRNHLFHFFPNGKYQLSLAEADLLVNRFLQIMEQALQCEVAKNEEIL